MVPPPVDVMVSYLRSIHYEYQAASARYAMESKLCPLGKMAARTLRDRSSDGKVEWAAFENKGSSIPTFALSNHRGTKPRYSNLHHQCTCNSIFPIQRKSIPP